jgi:adenine C2-methylase RlmN of 23S rRNA A2503 and tRNA A37
MKTISDKETAPVRRVLKDMTLEELTEFFAGIGEKPYRARQVFRWLMNGAASWDEMTNLSAGLRARLGEIATVDALHVSEVAVSRVDGTRKYLFETADGLFIETVLMEYYYGYSICISSQAGCRMGCRFCASGMHGLARDLTPGEIADQYIICERDVRAGLGQGEIVGSDEYGGPEMPDEPNGPYDLDRPDESNDPDGPVSKGDLTDRGKPAGQDDPMDRYKPANQSQSVDKSNIGHVRYVKHTGDDGKPRIGHIVVMGVGEPFDNYDNVMTFLKNVTDPQGRNLGRRQITVSTCGLLPEMRRFMNDLPQANLSLSLHAPNDGIRRRIMLVGAKYGVDELIAFAKEYSETTGRRFSFEYALFAGVNDSMACADELANKLAGGGFHVNLIPANSVGELGFKAPSHGRVTAFAERLIARGIRTTTRRELGADIAAACGQLRSERMARDIRKGF